MTDEEMMTHMLALDGKHKCDGWEHVNYGGVRGYIKAKSCKCPPDTCVPNDASVGPKYLERLPDALAVVAKLPEANHKVFVKMLAREMKLEVWDDGNIMANGSVIWALICKSTARLVSEAVIRACHLQ